jgi:F-type H+-transporting ATPase subunit b
LKVFDTQVGAGEKPSPAFSRPDNFWRRGARLSGIEGLKRTVAKQEMRMLKRLMLIAVLGLCLLDIGRARADDATVAPAPNPAAISSDALNTAAQTVGGFNSGAFTPAAIDSSAAAPAAAVAPADSAPAESAQPQGEAKEAPKPLLPPLDDGQTYVEALWVVIIFVILLAILYPTAWKNVLAGLKAREGRIRKDIAEAEAARLKSEATLKEYTAKLNAAENQIRDMLANARIEADKIATGVKMNAQQDAEEIKERATKEIEAAKKQALTEIYEQTADLATEVARKIIHRELNANDQRDLVAQSLDQLQAVGH